MTGIIIDRIGERLVRRLAGHTSRRGILSRLGLALAAAPVFPVLPISRAKAQGKSNTRGEGARTHFTMNSQTKDDTKCDYWRYCGIDGNLCACCGGGPIPVRPAPWHRPPPGSAPVSIPTTARPI
jgi:methylamine dehydrogenase light chain